MNPQVASDSIQVVCDLIQAGSDLIQWGPDFIQVGSDLVQVQSDLIKVGSDLIQAVSNLTQPRSDWFNSFTIYQFFYDYASHRCGTLLNKRKEEGKRGLCKAGVGLQNALKFSLVSGENLGCFARFLFSCLLKTCTTWNVHHLGKAGVVGGGGKGVCECLGSFRPPQWVALSRETAEEPSSLWASQRLGRTSSKNSFS